MTERTDAFGRTARLRVSRFKQEQAAPRAGRHFDEFEIGVEPDDTILDALLRIRSTLDPSLVVRHSCMRGSCGACGVRVDGREVLACDTPVPPDAARRPLTIEPIGGQRPIADLAVDMVDFQLRMNEVDMPLVRRAEPEAGARAADRTGPGAAEPPEGIRAYTRFEDCIECGLCLAACPVAAADRQYIGPAALAAAARVVAEPRGRDVVPILALAREPDSVWRCSDAMECSAVCPTGVDPANALISLRRRIAGRH